MHLLHYPRPNHHLFFFSFFSLLPSPQFLVLSPQSSVHTHLPPPPLHLCTYLPSYHPAYYLTLFLFFSFPRSVLFYILFRILFLPIPPPPFSRCP
ncbi:hypothetical protein F4809DRAFT_586131 [Biscogniauxia mediterranea]|nr:hypothetical protein F4809DRAFT_586131 [Biscogniauxia mediterranea]